MREINPRGTRSRLLSLGWSLVAAMICAAVVLSSAATTDYNAGQFTSLQLDPPHLQLYARNQPFGVLVRLRGELSSVAAFRSAVAELLERLWPAPQSDVWPESLGTGFSVADDLADLGLASMGTAGTATERETVVRAAEALWLQFEARVHLSRPERRAVVRAVRRFVARASQRALLREIPTPLRPARQHVEPFWISNVVVVQGASRELLEWLATNPAVAAVRPARGVAAVVEPIIVSDAASSSAPRRALEWNIAQILADKAWNITRGENVVVGIIDTGSRYTHEALVGNYRGNLGNGRFDHDYNWWDPKEFANDDWWCSPGLPCNMQPREECCAEYPYDIIGHGSHVTGSSVGSERFGIGVAPGAKWISAKGCRDGQCLNYGLITSAQWTLCPTKRDGSSPDCSLGADVVSNSWGGYETDDFYLDYVAAWRDAGIIPVFANGNSGPRCSTSGAPGNYVNVIGVGSTNKNDVLSRFSSRGPGPNEPGYAGLKPDISAPGEDIRSSYGNSDNAYSTISGTSMACPHISGVAALLLSANPSLTYEQVYEAMAKTAVQRLGAPAGNVAECDGKGYDVFPNYFYGYGRVDALAAVQYVVKNRN
eukprot:TRINITY_DN8723_c0_g1_i1.p1 TRINITY_DN8723_c0_g1~~TRINITY_DN8723_c0_g1_i1.p1  ORF type:complete len:598 (+),score=90.23 TRINITY_DN8723_c0_g1_i1:56-1849(+)